MAGRSADPENRQQLLLDDAALLSEDIPKVWIPTRDRPLPVFEVAYYHESGWWGLTNLMWTVARAISRGYECAFRFPVITAYLGAA